MSEPNHIGHSTLLNDCRAAIAARFPDIFPSSYPAFKAPEAGYFSDPAAFSAVTAVRCFGIERLIDEIGVLLSRCIQGRDAKLELEARALEFWLEIELADQRDAIRRQQIANGEYMLSSALADIDRQMQSEALSNTESSLQSRQVATKIRSAGDPVYENRVALTADVSSLSAFSNFGEVKKRAAELTESTMGYEKVAAMAEQCTTSASVALHRHLRKSAQKRYDVESANAPLRVDIFELEVKARAKRAAIATMPNVGLNYRQRFLEIQQMFEQDLDSLCRRLKALEATLQTQYGFTTTLPNSPSTSLTELVLWTRARLEDFWNICESEVSFSISISVKNQIGDAAWRQALNDGKVSLAVPADIAGSLNCVRLRRLRAHIVGQGIGNWCAMLRAPESATWRRPDDTIVNIDQTMSGKICLASIGGRTPGTDDSESVGRGIDGLSPIGNWTLEIGSHSDCGEPRSVIEDLFLTLDVTAIG